MIGIINVTDVEKMEGHLLDRNNPHGLTLGQLGGGLDANTTVFVSKSGNDTTGDGTSAKPFLTIGKAVNFLPRNINGRNCIINIAAGTYAEEVGFHDFHGGAVVLNGVSGATINISKLTVENCSVLVSDIHLAVGNGGIFIGAKGMFYCATGRVTVTGAANGVTLRYGAIMEITTQLTINNATGIGIWAQYCSTVSVANLLGSGNNIGVQVYQSVAYINSYQMTANAKVVNNNGAYYEKGVVG